MGKEIMENLLESTRKGKEECGDTVLERIGEGVCGEGDNGKWVGMDKNRRGGK